MTKITNDLIEAYKGYYEDENIPDFDNWVKTRIETDTPKARLEVYLHWNGIIGYTSRIWEISQGEIHV